MSKRKKFNEEDEAERLHKEIRELKSLNRSLLKRLKKVDRNYEEEIHKESEKEEPKKTKEEKVCPKCNEGQLIVSKDIPGREITRCGTCAYREVKKI